MRVHSKSLPVAAGVQSFMTIPFGTYTKARRTGAFVIARLAAARAGNIASSIGNAMAVPIPLRNVRLGMCLRVMIMALSLPFAFGTANS